MYTSNTHFRMQKIILTIAVLVVIGGGAWLLSSNNGAVEDTSITPTPEQPTTTNETETNLSGLGSFQSILGLGDSVRCEFKSTYEGQASAGTFYTDGERFRVESTIEGPDLGVITTTMINDGDFAYTWGTTPEGSMAIKMANPEVETSVEQNFTGPAAAEDSYVDFEQQVEYDCDRWRVDTGLFVPPIDIDFTDMEAMMREAMQGMPEGFEMPEGFPAP
jgi:hypothetical protein